MEREDKTTEETESLDNPVELVVKTFHLTVSYDGTDYHGWQVQPQHKTIQGEIRKRLRLMLRDPELKIAGCSRTDSGVHALDQHVSFEAKVEPSMTAEHLMFKLNRWLPDDILVLAASEVEQGFNARFSNFGKAYTYCISPGRRVSPLATRYVWMTPHELDVSAMRQAAAFLEGRHDFKSFTVNSGKEIEDTVRLLHRLELVEQNGLLYVVAVGESFLYKMVRSLAGYLVHVGQGYAKPENTPEVLASLNRCEAADSAPAKGLFLAKVFWEPDEWKSYEPLLPPFALSRS
ncbi:MAG: tRNA pseudouridine(38-40) synthase TruA [Victivallales bacterium]|nr:tRNA pseudouridine(38-40) synthase TruA [Victivallales bacterium]